MSQNSWKCSLDMLRAAVDGQTYDAIGLHYGVTRTAVERRVKTIAAQLITEVGVTGLNGNTAHFIGRLRMHRDELLAAMERYTPQQAPARASVPILSDDDIHLALTRIRTRSATPTRDLALIYILLCTGARPLEIARLEVRDYLDQHGQVRRESIMRAEASINELNRPLFFNSANAVTAIDRYLQERTEGSLGHMDAAYRGLDPYSRLFLTHKGTPFTVTHRCEGGHNRFHCRELLDVYRKIFRYINFPGVSALSLRHTVAARLYERGATEEQIGDIFGILEQKSVRERFPRPRKPLGVLVQELV